MIIDLGLRMDIGETEMSLTKERRASEEKLGFDRNIQEGNKSKQSKGFHNKCDQSDTLSSNIEEKKTVSNNLEQKTVSNDLEQTTLFTSPQPLTSLLQSCQQACTTCHAMHVASYRHHVIICSVSRRVINVFCILEEISPQRTLLFS